MLSSGACRELRGWAAAALLAAAPSALAEPTPNPSAESGRDIGFLLRMHLDFGGATLAEVQWSDGDTSTLKAGQLFTFSAGALYHPAAMWAVEATVGYKFDKVNGSNGTIEFTRIPLDVVASWAQGGHRLGGGATVHFMPKFNCDAIGTCSGTASYDTAFGGILQYAYGFRVGASGGFDLGLRYTLIQYRGTGLGTLDGNGFGFFFGGWL